MYLAAPLHIDIIKLFAFIIAHQAISHMTIRDAEIL